MPVTYRIDPDEGVVYLSVDGEVTFAEWRGVMLSALADQAYRPGLHFLYDGTGETDCPDTDFLHRCLALLWAHRVKMGDYRWALGSPRPALYGMQRMFAILGESQGRAFRDVGEAHRWLLADVVPPRCRQSSCSPSKHGARPTVRRAARGRM